MTKEELTPGADSGTTFTSVCINTAIYLPWLASQCLNNGVVFKRATFTHIADAAKSGVHHNGRPADIVVNCTGLASIRLGGVEDAKMYPARAQVVLVRNDADAMYSVSGTDDAPDEAMYIDKSRWRRNDTWRLLSARKLGISAGPESCLKNHEKVR